VTINLAHGLVQVTYERCRTEPKLLAQSDGLDCAILYGVVKPAFFHLQQSAYIVGREQVFYIGLRDVQDIDGAVRDALYAKTLAEGAGLRWPVASLDHLRRYIVRSFRSRIHDFASYLIRDCFRPC